MLRNFSKDIFIYGGTNAFKSLVPLLVLPALTVYLTPLEFGNLALIETFILFLSPFILLNINSSISVEYFKLNKSDFKYYVADCFVLTIISFVFFLLFFLCFSGEISNLFDIESSFVLLLPLFCFIRVAVIVALTIYQSSQSPLTYLNLSITQTLIDVGLSLLFVTVFCFGLSGRLWGIHLGFFFAGIISFIYLIKGEYLCYPKFIYFKRILLFACPLIPHTLSASLIILSGRLFISNYYTNDEVGLYSVAYQVASIMLLVGVSINQAWSPMLFKILKKNEYRIAIRYSYYLTILFIVIGLVIFFIKDILYYILVDDSFSSSIEIFPVLLLGLVFQCIYFLVSNFIFFEGKTKQLALFTTSGAILNLFLNYIFIDRFGVLGVAYSSVVTWFYFMVSVFCYGLIIYSSKRV